MAAEVFGCELSSINREQVERVFKGAPGGARGPFIAGEQGMELGLSSMVSLAHSSVHGSTRTDGGDSLQRRATKGAKALRALIRSSKRAVGR